MLGFDLRFGQLEVEMRMLMVITGGVSAILDVIVIILGLLGDATRQEALALLGDNVGDVSTFGFEIVLHHLGFIFTAIVLENRISHEVPDAVGDADGMNLAAVHVHADLGCAHVDITIQDLAAAIHHGMIAAEEDDAVLGIELNHMIQVHTLKNEAARVGRRLVLLSMRQHWQQHEGHYRCKDNMKTTRQQCLVLSIQSAKIVQINSTASRFWFYYLFLAPHGWLLKNTDDSEPTNKKLFSTFVDCYN